MPSENRESNVAIPECPLCGQQAKKRMTLRHTRVMACANPSCELMFAFPQLSSEQLDAAYREFYYPDSDSASVPYENTPEEILRHTFAKATSMFGPLKGKSLLDFGCGVGRFCRVAREHGLRTTGIEPDAVARKSAAKNEELKVYASIDDLQIAEPETRFDIITMWEVVEHLREPWRELKQLSRLLRPGGQLLLSTPNAGSLRARLQRQRWENMTNPTHFYYFTQRSLWRTLKRAGLSDVNGWRFPIPYPGHSPLRRIIHRTLLRLRLQGQTFVIAR
jgi:2-polyprenyl-3-methyl-5-hydroxy-6-metoxy-1,4-benzoquinol methylase